MAIMSVQVKYDGIGRITLMRECVANSDREQGCRWCGNSPARLFEYYGYPLRSGSHLFCNVDCLNSYN
jgi:hypothetical protein